MAVIVTIILVFPNLVLNFTKAKTNLYINPVICKCILPHMDVLCTQNCTLHGSEM